jgi:glycosyltransferase involved in cell wall biosynthesis
MVVTPSEWMMNALQIYFARPSHAAVIHNGRSPALFDPNAEKHDRVVSVGRLWDQAKQVSLLAQRAHPAPVWIVGSQDHPEKVMNGYTAGTAIPGITFCGAQSEQEIRTLLAHASIYAATSCYEPFGLAPVEAALSRCALIANHIPSFRELWGDAACYFQSNDPDSLADAVRSLNSNDQLRKNYADRAYERALQNFSADRMLDAYENLYGTFVSQEAAA